MTVREAAIRLEVSVSLTYALVYAGKLRCTRHGLGRGCIRVSEEQLVDYLAGTEPKPQAPRPALPRKAFRHVRLPS
jgi:excisionase family DNA binding protein